MLKSRRLHKKSNNSRKQVAHSTIKRRNSTLKQIIANNASNQFDAIIIGAGIAGAAAALGITTPKLAETPTPGTLKMAKPLKKVLVIEQEQEFCRHSTGRTAAIFSELYGSPTVRALSTASKPFFYNPTEFGLLESETGATNDDLVKRRGSLWVCTDKSDDQLTELYNSTKSLVPTLQLLNQKQLHDIVPATKWSAAQEPMYYDEDLAALYGEDHGSYTGLNAILEVDAGDMDVNNIYNAVSKVAKHNGADFVLGTTIEKSNFDENNKKSTWTFLLKNVLPDGSVETVQVSAPVVVNAGGPFADYTNELLGVEKRKIIPKKRTIIQFQPQEFVGPDGSKMATNEQIANFDKWPCVFDLDDRFYYKPDAGRVLASPAEETDIPEPIHEHADVVPDELDIAICVQRLEQASFFSPKNIVHKWSGLRSFAPDREFIMGFDGGNHLCQKAGESTEQHAARIKNETKSVHATHLLHVAGLGGFGIQSLGGQMRVIAGLYHNSTIPQDLLEMGVDPAVICPQREFVEVKH